MNLFETFNSYALFLFVSYFHVVLLQKKQSLCSHFKTNIKLEILCFVTLAV
jgi:hypothetical protein